MDSICDSKRTVKEIRLSVEVAKRLKSLDSNVEQTVWVISMCGKSEAFGLPHVDGLIASTRSNSARSLNSANWSFGMIRSFGAEFGSVATECPLKRNFVRLVADVAEISMALMIRDALKFVEPSRWGVVAVP